MGCRLEFRILFCGHPLKLTQSVPFYLAPEHGSFIAQKAFIPRELISELPR